MSKEGKIRVVVRSQRVPVGTTTVTMPVYTASGFRVSSVTRRYVLYETRLDHAHRNAIEKGKRLSCDLGLALEVVDRSRSGLVRRLLGLGRGGSETPSVLISPSAEAPSESSWGIAQHR